MKLNRHKWNKALIAAVLSIAFCSCKTAKLPIRATYNDSTIVEIREVEKVVRVPAETLRVTMPILFRDSVFVPATAMLESKRAKVVLEINQTGNVTAMAECKELEEKVTLLERTISTRSKEIEIYQEKENKLANAYRNVKRTLNTVLITVALVAVALLVFRYRKILTTLFKNLLKLF